MKVYAGIVVYHPDFNRLKENINSIYSQVESLILVINGYDSLDIAKSCSSGRDNIFFIINHENKGIAQALIQIMQFAILNECDWVLSLDQDSVVKPSLIDTYKKYMFLEKVAVFTCNIEDRNFIEETGFKINEEFREVDKCITAACFMNVEAYRNCDGYDKKMFIDAVDWDICLNLRRHGYKIYKINYNGLLQEVGKAKSVKLFSKKYITYGHSPLRNYYQARNNVYITKKYPEYLSKLKAFLIEIRTILLIVLFESNKIMKVLQRIKGIYDGFKLFID